MAATPHTTFRLPDDTRQRLGALAREWGCTQTDVVVRLIDRAQGPVGPRPLDGQMTLLGAPVDPAPVHGHVPAVIKERAAELADRTAARRAQRDPDDLDRCSHDSSTLSTITNLRRCDRCGAVQGTDGAWR